MSVLTVHALVKNVLKIPNGYASNDETLLGSLFGHPVCVRRLTAILLYVFKISIVSMHAYFLSRARHWSMDGVNDTLFNAETNV